MKHLITTCCLSILAVWTFSLVYGKVYTRCELAEALLKEDIPKSDLNDWVCLSTYESDLNTSAINEYNVDGSWDYGIFQINSHFWCQGQKTKTNGCGVKCTVLLQDNLDSSILCAKKIYKEQGISAWVAWKKKCKGHNISHFTADCELDVGTTTTPATTTASSKTS